jgi:exo-beta-1,3-glucanase (GH17 family)
LKTQRIEFAVPVALLLISLCIIAVVWAWLGSPVMFARSLGNPVQKLDCVSYTPFRGSQSPWNSELIISPEEIARDLAELTRSFECIRIYSVDNGLNKVPELASRGGLNVILGIWIGRDRIKNAQLVERALLLVEANPGVITSIIVGNEVLLRGEMTAADLRAIIRSVKARVNIPVTYADVWEFWVRFRELADDVDYVTIHILPYWEDTPVRAEDAAAHVDDVRSRIALAFPGKEIFIGETGWPSHGRMRNGALPSRINQARFISDLLERADRNKFRLSLFEAYDERWKRQWEGTVGGSWGLFARDIGPKYPPRTAVSDHPFWLLQLALGLLFCVSIFGTAFTSLRRRHASTQRASWAAVAVCAIAGGSLLGLAVEKMFSESYGVGDWLIRGVLLVSATAAPVLSSDALVSGRALPTFLELIGPRDGKPLARSEMILGFALIVTTVIAAETALALVFDPRWRDFPFAVLTMAAVPFAAVTLVNRTKTDTRPLAEAIFARLFAAAAIYILLNEGPHNWQAIWTCATYVLFGIVLWQIRAVSVTSAITLAPRIVAADMLAEQVERVVEDKIHPASTLR